VLGQKKGKLEDENHTKEEGKRALEPSLPTRSSTLNPGAPLKHIEIRGSERIDKNSKSSGEAKQ